MAEPPNWPSAHDAVRLRLATRPILPLAGAGSARMRTLVLINAAGGTIRREGGVEVARQRLQVAFAAHAGVTAELRFAMGDELARHASEALGHGRRGDLDAVIVGGGDGSVGTV